MIEFEDVGIDMGDGYSAGSFDGEFDVNRDGTITDILVRASKMTANGWVRSHTFVPNDSPLFDLLSKRLGADYSADIDAVAERKTYGSRRVRSGFMGGGSSRGDHQARF
jgi:hypothetical protein